MSKDREPRPRCPIERRLQALEAVKLRHYQMTRVARLEREIAALPDPAQPTANEMSSRASDARIDAILRDMGRTRTSSDPDEIA